MNIEVKEVEIKDVAGIITSVYQDKTNSCEQIEKIKSTGVFEGKEGEVFYYTTQEGKYIILTGLGKEKELTGETIRCAMAKAAKKAKELKINTLSINFPETDKVCVGGRVKAIAEGILLSLYTFEKYKNDKIEYLPEIFISGVPVEKIEKAKIRLNETLNLIESVNIARNLVNEPANVLYPETLAYKVEDIGKKAGFEVEVFDRTDIKEMKMDAMWAVGKGSSNSPRLIVMRYMGNTESNEILGLVGKGLTYDTGGYSLKPNDSMKDMKSDMGGAASVIGVMNALAKNKAKCNVVAVVAAVENAISGNAYKPGDIINSMAGKTIEVLNTDAEGRLTLADAVTYIIRKEKVDKVIDVATLTGAVLVALGETTTGVITNNQSFYDELIKASEKTGEHFWNLPVHKEYKKLIKSDIADLKNTGGRNAGTITAGLFIGEFVEDKPWLHLDIAGTAWGETATDYLPKGGTGVPVRTLYQLANGACSCNK